MQTVSPIPQLTEALLDPKPFPAKLLYLFSDLLPEDHRELAKLWPRIPLERRRNLLKDLVELNDSDFLYDFDAVGRTALEDEDVDVVCGGIDLLFTTEDKQLIPLYLHLLRDQKRNELIRAAAANALGPYVYFGEMEDLPENKLHEIEEALLKAYAEDPSEHVRRRALESMGYSSREEVPAMIRKAVDHVDPKWVESGLFAIGRSADDQWEEHILEHLDDPDHEIRLQAIHAAGGVGLSAARAPLLKLISPKADVEFRKEAIWALSQIGGEGVEEAFMRLQNLSDDDEELNLLEEAVDTLNFVNDGGLYEMLDVEEEDLEKIAHGHSDSIEETDEEIEHPDYAEWEKYLDEDGEFADDDDDDEDALYFEDEEDEDPLDEDR
ncbi:MAG TPA: HEAT repeat domain-containing protein [Anaerolineaceae bacterium]|nr:HEAT repeat domain-containing protein [Anaerolineaceae bacterium]